MAPTPTRNNTVPAANRKPMNRTSKRIICLSVQTLDQPKDQPKTSLRSALGTENRHQTIANSPALLNTISAGPKTLAERDSRRFRNPLRRFYKAPAVAKLGLLRRDGKSLSIRRSPGRQYDDPPVVNSTIPGRQLDDPAVAIRLAKNPSIACAIEPTARERHPSETRCSRSPLLET